MYKFNRDYGSYAAVIKSSELPIPRPYVQLPEPTLVVGAWMHRWECEVAGLLCALIPLADDGALQKKNQYHIEIVFHTMYSFRKNNK